MLASTRYGSTDSGSRRRAQRRSLGGRRTSPRARGLESREESHGGANASTATADCGNRHAGRGETRERFGVVARAGRPQEHEEGQADGRDRPDPVGRGVDQEVGRRREAGRCGEVAAPGSASGDHDEGSQRRRAAAGTRRRRARSGRRARTSAPARASRRCDARRGRRGPNPRSPIPASGWCPNSCKRDAPEVVAVRAEAAEVGRRGLVRRAVLESAPLVAGPVPGVVDRREERDRHRDDRHDHGHDRSACDDRFHRAESRRRRSASA